MGILTVGEALACLVPEGGTIAETGRFVQSFGGAELNTAIGLARLGNSVAWASRVGTDALGHKLMDVLAHEGVDTSLVLRAEGEQTALMLKERVTPDESRVSYYRGNSAASRMQPGDVSAASIRAASWLHVTGVTLAIGSGVRQLMFEVVQTAAESGVPVSFDPNFRPRLIARAEARSVSRALLPYVTHMLCNEEEAVSISGSEDAFDSAKAIADLGPQVVIVKRGARGAVAVVDDRLYEQAAWPVERPVDPVGAGDAFNAGWLHSQLHGMGVRPGLGLASFVAAKVVEHRGDYEGFPDLEQAETWQAETSGARPSATHATAPRT